MAQGLSNADAFINSNCFSRCATREVLPIEQHIHAVLEMLPFTGLLIVIALHWEQFTALFGFGTAHFELKAKGTPLPWTYILTMLVLTLLFELLPYLEELWRGFRRRPPPAVGGTTRTATCS